MMTLTPEELLKRRQRIVDALYQVETLIKETNVHRNDLFAKREAYYKELLDLRNIEVFHRF